MLTKLNQEERHRGVRSFSSDGPPTLRLASCPFAFPRTPLPIAETLVFVSIGAQPCGATDLSVFHSRLTDVKLR